MSYRVGVDLGGTKIAVGLVDGENRIVSRVSGPTEAHRPAREVLAHIARLTESALSEANVSREACTGLGIGSPGMVDAPRGVVTYSCNLDWTQVEVCGPLEELIKLPCKIENDANCAALGEVAAGAARGKRDAVMVTLGTGVGSGIVLGGRIFAGQASAGAELGHTLFVYDGEECSCGRRGCLERYTSGTALQRQAQRMALERPDSALGKLAQEEITGRTPFELMDRDQAAREVVETYLSYVGAMVTDITNLFRPQAVVLGGGVSREGERLLAPIRQYVRAHAYGGTLAPLPEVVAATLGPDAGIIGAANL